MFAALSLLPPSPGDLPCYLRVRQSLRRGARLCHQPNWCVVMPWCLGSLQRSLLLAVLEITLQEQHKNASPRKWSLVMQSRQDFNREHTGMKNGVMKASQQHRLMVCNRQAKALLMGVQVVPLTQSSCPAMASHSIHLPRTHQGRHCRCTPAPAVRLAVPTAL